MIPKIALPLLPALFSSGAIGGSSAKTDRGQELASYGDLSNIFNYGINNAKSMTGTGQVGVKTGTEDLGTAANYLKNLTAGGRSNIMQAAAPEIAAATSANDAAKRQLATSGTARGGGTAAINQERDAATQAQIDQALFNVRPKAAGELAQVGQAEGALGLGETSAGLKSADLAETSARDLGDLANKNRSQSYKIHQDTVNTISQGIEDTLAGIAGAM